MKIDHKKLLGYRIEKPNAITAKKGNKGVVTKGSKGPVAQDQA